MNFLPLVLLSTFFLLAPTPVHAQATAAPLVYSAITAPLFIEEAAKKYNINSTQLEETLKCESGFQSNAIGDQGRAIGVAQIRLDYHSDITRAEALDPMWSVDFAAREFATGHADEWTCFRHLRD